MDDLLRLVEELLKAHQPSLCFHVLSIALSSKDNKEWLQGPTARGTGRKNMYDVTPELIIA